MELRLLGPLELTDGSDDVPVPGARLRALLALLAINAGRPLATDAIADALWGEQPPGNTANALQKLVSKLRRTLPVPDALVTEPAGYRLELAPGALDVREFERLVSAGEYADALALWRGPVLVEFTYEEWAQAEIVRLSEMRANAIEARVDADLARGRYAGLVPELETLVAEYPVRERLRGQLMVALYGAGRQADALRAFQDARDTLGEELGLEPGPELREVEARILAHDPTLIPAAPLVSAPRGNVRAPLSSLIGRVDELAAIGAAIDDARVVTLVGPGGAGKTRLATEVALARQPSTADGAWFVDLALVSDADAVADAIADTLGIPEVSPSETTIDRVVGYLRTKHVLLVLDNCEHLVASTARATVDIATACPHVRILATSREALGVPGERLWPVPPLNLDDAIALFADRARAVDPRFDADADAPVVADICNRLDGLPLALELAAARVRVLSPADVAARLDERFRLLTGGARTVLPRHQTLRAVVDWSYELLFDDERRAFERLSVFTGGCDLAAAESVVADDELPSEEVSDLVTRLVDKSLVVADRVDGRTRFRLLQTLFDYAREQLYARGDVAATRDRHLAYFDRLCDLGDETFYGGAQRKWFAIARHEAENLRGAFEWAVERKRADLALHIASAVGRAWWVHGKAAEGLLRLERALALDGESDRLHRGRAMIWRAWLAYNSWQPIPEGYYEETMANFVDGDADAAQATFVWAELYFQIGRRDRALPMFADAVARFEAASEGPHPGVVAYARGRMQFTRGDIGNALETYGKAVTESEACGDLLMATLASSQLSDAAEQCGDLVRAQDALERARDHAYTLGIQGAHAHYTARLGNLAMLAGDYDRARELHDAALARARELAWGAMLTVTLNGIAIRLRREGRLDEAEAAAGEALALYSRIDEVMGASQASATLGYVAEERGDLDEAERRHRSGLELARRAGPAQLALALEGLAAISVKRDRPGEAARLLGKADALRREVGSRLHGTALIDIDRVEVPARAALGASYEEAFAEGAHADIDALV